MGDIRSSGASELINEVRSIFRRGLRVMGMDMREKIELRVHLARDDESGIWYVAESEVPGLRLEADSAAALVQRIEAAVPDLIELNLGEILEDHLKNARLEKARQNKPNMSVRPVFDSPLELACA